MEVSPSRQSLLREARRPILPRILNEEIKWVGCMYPTPGIAQDAHMSHGGFADFLYGACVTGTPRRADAADRRPLRRRRRGADRRRRHRPDVPRSPVGTATSTPAPRTCRRARSSQPSRGLGERRRHFRRVPRLVRRSPGGSPLRGRPDPRGRRPRPTRTSCSRHSARRRRGCAPPGRVRDRLQQGSTAYGNALFDEKIHGTIHLAIEASFPFLGGKNESVVHWDIVKELRNGGEIWLDGELVQDGTWQF